VGDSGVARSSFTDRKLRCLNRAARTKRAAMNERQVGGDGRLSVSDKMAALPHNGVRYPCWWDGGRLCGASTARVDEHRSEPESVDQFVLSCGRKQTSKTVLRAPRNPANAAAKRLTRAALLVDACHYAACTIRAREPRCSVGCAALCGERAHRRHSRVSAAGLERGHSDSQIQTQAAGPGFFTAWRRASRPRIIQAKCY